MQYFLAFGQVQFFGFGPGRRLRAKYSLTAFRVVTQLRPIFTPQSSSSRINRER